MNIIPWRRSTEPSLVSLRSGMERLFDDFFENGNGSSLLARRSFPLVNVAESEKSLSVTAELPGMSAADIDVKLVGNQLVISGERKWEDEKKGKEFHRVEVEYGAFQRTIALPPGLRLEGGEIAARYEKGLLTIEIPKLEPTPTAKIKVKAV